MREGMPFEERERRLAQLIVRQAAITRRLMDALMIASLRTDGSQMLETVAFETLREAEASVRLAIDTTIAVDQGWPLPEG